MEHFVYKQVLFTIGKDYNGNTDKIKLNYVNCQWQNFNKEVCEVDILVSPDEFFKALEGDNAMRDFIFMTYTYHLMNLFNPAIIS